ncbi:hypothetical protein [Rhizobium sp.]
MQDADNEYGIWLYILIQDLLKGIGLVTFIFVATVMAFSIAYSWRLFFQIGSRRLAVDDPGGEIMSRYLSSSLFKAHLVIYVAAVFIFAATFLFDRLG